MIEEMEDRSFGSYTPARIFMVFFLFLVSRYIAGQRGTGLFAIYCLWLIIITGLDHRVGALLSLGSLGTIIVYLLLDNEGAANAWAVLLYYLLCVTVIGGIYQDSRLAKIVSIVLDTHINHRILMMWDMLKRGYNYIGKCAIGVIGGLQYILGKYIPGVGSRGRYMRNNHIGAYIQGLIKGIQHIVHIRYWYIYIGLIIRGPWLLHTGYLISLDRLPIIIRSWSEIHTPRILFPSIALIWNTLGLPVWMINNLFWILPFPLLGYYTHRLLKSYPRYAQVFGVGLMICNPFIYARMIDGQLNVVWMIVGRAMLFVYSREYDIYYKGFGQGWFKIFFPLLVLIILIPMFSIHSIFGLMMLCVIFCVTTRRSWHTKLIHGIGGIIIIVVANLYRIIPTFVGNNDAGATIQQMDDSHRQAFATQGGSTNIYRNTLSLRGYRGEVQQRFLPHYLFNPNYHMMMIVILILVWMGIRYQYPRQKWQTLGYISIGVGSWILSHGEQGIFGSLSYFLYHYVPGYAGLREPHKWISILLVIYAYFSSIGLYHIGSLLSRHHTDIWIRRGVLMICLLLPILYTPAMTFGLWGQIMPKTHPSTWQTVQTYMTTVKSPSSCSYQTQYDQTSCYRAIVLPWHGYTTISRIGKRVGTWVTHYFGSDLLIGDPVEFAGIYTQTVRPASLLIQGYVNNDTGLTFKTLSRTKSFLNTLKSMGISEIILLKEADRNMYQSGLQMLDSFLDIKIDNEHVRLYHIK